MNKHLREILFETEYSCDGCENILPYEQALNHLNFCISVLPVACFQGCGNDLPENLMEIHCLEKCEKTIFTCLFTG